MKSQIHEEIDVAENELINLPAKLLEHSQTRPNDVAMRHKKFGIWKEFTWEEYLNKVRSASLGFDELGVREGDKIVIHSENRPEWLISDLAIMLANGITVPAYTTSTTSDYQQTHNPHCYLFHVPPWWRWPELNRRLNCYPNRSTVSRIFSKNLFQRFKPSLFSFFP